jgi:hypothetical protein
MGFNGGSTTILTIHTQSGTSNAPERHEKFRTQFGRGRGEWRSLNFKSLHSSNPPRNETAFNEVIRSILAGALKPNRRAFLSLFSD